MGRRATKAERQPPDRVGSARLTCGQPSDQPASAQVRPKVKTSLPQLAAHSRTTRPNASCGFAWPKSSS